MACLPFGTWEVNEAFQRAIDFEEEEDDQIYQEEKKIEDTLVIRLSPELRKLSSNSEEKLRVNELIIAIGEIPTAFINAYLLNCEESSVVGLVNVIPCIDKVREQKSNTWSQRTFSDRTCFMHRVTAQPDVLYCQCKVNVKMEQTFDWVSKVFSKINPTVVVILSSTTRCNFQSETSRIPEGDFIRQLKTDNYTCSTKIQALEQPNLVKDLPAAVLTHCQVHGIAAISYICLTESHHFDVTPVKTFQQILQDEPFASIKKNPEHQVKATLKEFCNMKIDDGGIYI